MEQWQQYEFEAEDKEVHLDILITRALCYSSLQKKQAFQETWQEMQKKYRDHEKITSFAQLVLLDK